MEFNQDEWNIKIKEESKKIDDQNPDKFHPAFNHSGTSEIILPGEGFIVYRVPMDIWYDYHDAKHNTKMDRQ